MLDLVEADRARRCAQILGEATAAPRRCCRRRTPTRARACARRSRNSAQRRRERIAAAQARLATQRRLHEQQRTAALLRLAWQHLPGELLALWQRAGRARGVGRRRCWHRAQARMPRGPWRIVHAPDWPAAERQALAQQLAAEPGAAPRFEADAGDRAGLKVVADGNVIDGTLDGLLADRPTRGRAAARWSRHEPRRWRASRSRTACARGR